MCWPLRFLVKIYRKFSNGEYKQFFIFWQLDVNHEQYRMEHNINKGSDAKFGLEPVMVYPWAYWVSSLNPHTGLSHTSLTVPNQESKFTWCPSEVLTHSRREIHMQDNKIILVKTDSLADKSHFFFHDLRYKKTLFSLFKETMKSENKN